MLSKPYTKLLTILFLFILCSVPHTVLADDYRITADHILTAYYGPGGDIVLPKEVYVVGVSAFMNNKTITSVMIQEGCHTIQDGAFDNCSNMTSISLPSTLEEIGEFAFARCTNLKSCYLPSNITRILDGAFRECHALEYDWCTLSAQCIASADVFETDTCANITSLNLLHRVLVVRVHLEQT